MRSNPFERDAQKRGAPQLSLGKMIMIKSSAITLFFIILLTGCSSIYETFIAGPSKQELNMIWDEPQGLSRPNAICRAYKSKVYAGVKKDAAIIPLCFDSAGWSFFFCPYALYSIIDMPFSAISDTVLLLHTVPDKNKNSGHFLKPNGEDCT